MSLPLKKEYGPSWQEAEWKGQEALVTLCPKLGSRWAQFPSFFGFCIESWPPAPGVLLPELQVGTLTVKLFANSLKDKPRAYLLGDITNCH